MVAGNCTAAMVEKDSAYLELEAAGRERRGAGDGGAGEVEREIPNIDHRYGDGRGEVLGIGVYSARGQKVGLLEPGAEDCGAGERGGEGADRVAERGVHVEEPPGRGLCGDEHVAGGVDLAVMEAGDVTTVDFHVRLPHLHVSGVVQFSPALADGGLMSYKMCDWIDNAVTLQMGHGGGAGLRLPAPGVQGG